MTRFDLSFLIDRHTETLSFNYSTATHTHTQIHTHTHTHAPMIVLLGAHTSTRLSSDLTQWYINISPWHFGFVSHIFSFDLFSKTILFSGQASTITRAAFVSLHTWSCNKKTNHWLSYILETCYQTILFSNLFQF